jgi:glucans biosynthesis protein C
MQSQRYYGLDALRCLMMICGIVIHGAYFYIIERLLHGQAPNKLLILVTSLLHRFQMPLFFILGGFVTAMLVEKYGLRGAYLNRARRMLIPFLAAVVTVLPLTLWLYFSVVLTSINNEVSFVGSLASLDATLKQMAAWNLPTVSFMHLWFLHYLLFFYLFIPLCEYVVARLKRDAWQPRMQRLMSSPWSVLMFALLTAATLWPYPGGYVSVDDRSPLPDPWNAVHFGSFYFLGYLFFHYREIFATFQNHLLTFGMLALVTFAAISMPATPLVTELMANQPLVVMVNALCTWGFVCFLAGLFLRRYNRNTARVRFMSQSLYWVYLMHIPTVFLCGVLLTQLPVHDVGKFAILTCITLAICFSSYLLIRHTWIGVLLSGGVASKVGGVEQVPQVRVQDQSSKQWSSL